MYLLYIFPPLAPHTYDFVVLISLTQPRKIFLVVLQIGKAIIPTYVVLERVNIWRTMESTTAWGLRRRQSRG
jgi:hypothetical protein